MITYEQIADWVLANRSGNAFLGYSKPEIVAELMDRIDYDLVWYHATDNQINGIVIADEIAVNGYPVIFVRNAIAKQPDVIRDFLERYQKTYTDFALCYEHRGKKRCVNVKRWLSRLTLTPH